MELYPVHKWEDGSEHILANSLSPPVKYGIDVHNCSAGRPECKGWSEASDMRSRPSGLSMQGELFLPVQQAPTVCGKYHTASRVQMGKGSAQLKIEIRFCRPHLRLSLRTTNP